MINSKSIGLLIAWACLLLNAGCVSNLSMDSHKSVLPAGIEMTTVRTSSALENHVDTVNSEGKIKIPTGTVFKRVFAGGDDSHGVIDLINSRAIIHMGGFNPLLPPTVWFTYSASVSYTKGEKTHILSATANSSERISAERAAQEAVEFAVTDLAMQVRAISK
jgi:hypothetical protein